MNSDANTTSREQALLAYQRGESEAVARLASALDANPNDGGLLIAEARARAAAGDPEALDRLRTMLRRAPDWLDGHVAFAQLCWEAGEREDHLGEFELALRRLPAHAGLWFRYITAIAGSGLPARAADVARGLRTMGRDGPALRLVEAHHAGMAGDVARADALLATVADDHPDKPIEVARQRLRARDVDGASRQLDAMRAAGAMTGAAWALAELAWRAAGDPRHRWLIDPRHHVRPIELDIAVSELEALAVVLRRMHRASGRPLGQSVRDGTQTPGNIWLRGEAEIAALRERLIAAVADFTAALPPVEAGHPLWPAASGTLGLATGWSVLLTAGGHHISHIHAHGVLSSACYVAVPGETRNREGWLELGRPPADIPLDLPPLGTVRPRPGLLVLFPSFLYHGTRPTRSDERLTVAFDAAPAR